MATLSQVCSIADFKKTLYSNGFLASPLTDEQISHCLRVFGNDAKTCEPTYNIACDVFSGLSFEEAMEAALS